MKNSIRVRGVKLWNYMSKQIPFKCSIEASKKNMRNVLRNNLHCIKTMNMYRRYTTIHIYREWDIHMYYFILFIDIVISVTIFSAVIYFCSRTFISIYFSSHVIFEFVLLQGYIRLRVSNLSVMFLFILHLHVYSNCCILLLYVYFMYMTSWQTNKR